MSEVIQFELNGSSTYHYDENSHLSNQISVVPYDLNNKGSKFFTYKALNKLIQGSAADMTKKAMLDLYKEGIIAHIQIHDELDISVESDKKAKRIIEIMETAVDLEVPNKVDYESGKTWGNIYD